MNWKTNEVSSLETAIKSDYYPVAVALPKGFFKNNCEYCIYADPERVILVNLNTATSMSSIPIISIHFQMLILITMRAVEQVYASPPKFKPQFLQLWPGDPSRFFIVGSIMHVREFKMCLDLLVYSSDMVHIR